MKNPPITVRQSPLIRTVLVAGMGLFALCAVWVFSGSFSWYRISVYEVFYAAALGSIVQSLTWRLILDDQEIVQRACLGRTFRRPYSEVAAIHVGHSKTTVLFAEWKRFTPIRMRLEYCLDGCALSQTSFSVSHRLLHPQILVDTILARAGRDVPVTIEQGKIRIPKENGPGEKRTD
jgi:hypothetical protein